MRYKTLPVVHSGIIFAATCVVLLICAFSVAIYADAIQRAKHTSDKNNMLAGVRGRISVSLDAAVTSVRALEGFITARFQSMPNKSDPTLGRLYNQDIPGVADLAAALLNTSRYVSYFYTFPGGMLSQWFPASNQYTRGLDVLVPSNPSYWSNQWSVETGNILVEPRLLRIGTSSSMGVFIRVPIFNSSTVFGMQNWWGNVAGAILFDEIVKYLQLADGSIAGPNWVVQIDAFNATSILAPTMIDERVTRNHTDLLGRPSDLEATVVLSNNASWRLRFWFAGSNRYALSGDGYAVVPVIVAPIAVAVLIVIVVNVVHAYATRRYDGLLHAPKQVPLAFMVVGIVRGHELWTLDAETFVQASEQLRERVEAAVTNHRGYVTQVLAPHSFSVVTRSVDAAVHLSFSLIEELELDPIYFSMTVPQPNLNESGMSSSTSSSADLEEHHIPLQITCAIHWCRHVDVSVEPEEREFRYTGKSVVYTSKLFSAAMQQSVGADIWLSFDACRVAEYMSGVSIAPAGEVQFLRTPALQEVFTITDPDSVLLKNAAISAKEAKEAHDALSCKQKAVCQHYSSDSAHYQRNDVVLMHDDVAVSPRRVDRRTSLMSQPDGADGHARSLLGSIKMDTTLLYPMPTPALRTMFEEIFDPLADTYPQYEFQDLLHLFTHFYNAFFTMLKPFAASERDNVLRRLAVSFALPQQQLLGHLSVICALQSLRARSSQRKEKDRETASSRTREPSGGDVAPQRSDEESLRARPTKHSDGEASTFQSVMRADSSNVSS